jgi:hypothetical protein
MKHYILITLLFIGAFGFAQQTIKPIETENIVPNTDNTYFKDVNNQLDKFVGTWKYEDTNTNTVFEITLTKILHQEVHKNSFADELIAQFKLTVNGVELYNTYTIPCADCVIDGGFRSERIYNPSTTYYTIIPPNVNTYFMCIAEPDFEDDVLASNLKLVHQRDLVTGNAQLIWTNKVREVTYYQTTQVVNIYKMPHNMILIKQ